MPSRTRRTRPTTAREIAPHLDRRWADAFLLEARLLDVPGDRIGDALGEADAHCRDSGEDATRAFGDPGDYARSIAETAPRRRAAVLPHLVPLVPQIAGMVTVITAVGELTRGREVTLTWGAVTMLVVLLAGCAGVAVLADRMLALIVHRPVVAAAALGACATAVLVPSVLLLQWDAAVAVVPAPLAGVTGLALLVAGAVLTRVLQGRAGLADPVVGPGDAPDDRRPGLGLVPWTVLGWTVVGSVVVWAIAR